MRKTRIIAALIGAVVLAVPSAASAKVVRCDLTTVTNTGPKVATFTVLQPKDQVGQFVNVWVHKYEVAITDPTTGSFVGTGKIYDNGATGENTTWTETVTGSLNADGTLSMQTTPVGGGATFKVTNAPMNMSEVPVDTNGTWPANEITFKIGAPSYTGGAVTTTVEYKNHGEYVNAADGGKEAAQACAGMPVNSTQGK